MRIVVAQVFLQANLYTKIKNIHSLFVTFIFFISLQKQIVRRMNFLLTNTFWWWRSQLKKS